MLLALLLAGCAHTASGTSGPPELRAFIGQPCRGMHTTPRAPGAPAPRIAIEIASVLMDDMPEPFAQWVVQHEVPLAGATTLLVENDSTEIAPWSTCPTDDCLTPNVWALAVTPHVSSEPNAEIELTFLLKPTSGLAEVSQAAVVRTPDQRPAALPFEAVDNGRPSTLVATPYRIDDDGDLQKLMGCRAQGGLGRR